MSSTMGTARERSREYELTCTDCSFNRVVDGDIDDLYDVIEAHQEATAAHFADHAVDFTARSACD